MRHAQLAAALVVAVAVGCGGGRAEPSADSGRPLPWPRTLLSEPKAPADNPATPEKLELGRLLFYDPILSSDRQVACATCHSEIWGLSDGLALSIGVDGSGPTGPGRTGPHSTRRNAQTLWNVAYRDLLFWDGRTASLEEQALQPIATEVELGRDVNELAVELAANPGYAALFAAAFPDEPAAVDARNLARALAAFERTFVSVRSPYDRYAAGDAGALNDETLRGMLLFAEAGCASCHVPPLFGSETYADRGVPNPPDVDDNGRFEVTGESRDVRRFRTPTLRNLRDTEPYFHAGSIASLEGAILHEVREAERRGETRALAPHEIAALVSFLDKGLIDLSRSPNRPREVPSGLAVPRDGFRIPR